jgi:4-hydroxy-tetrahydrodipicolinate synthase
VAANGYPKPFCEMVHLMLEGKEKEALPLHYKMLRMNGLIFADGNPAGIKALMAHEGLCKNVLRLPLVPVSDIVRQDIENEYDNNLK